MVVLKLKQTIFLWYTHKMLREHISMSEKYLTLVYFNNCQKPFILYSFFFIVHNDDNMFFYLKKQSLLVVIIIWRHIRFPISIFYVSCSAIRIHHNFKGIPQRKRYVSFLHKLLTVPMWEARREFAQVMQNFVGPPDRTFLTEKNTWNMRSYRI